MTILATTALEWSWGKSGPILFLGEWCRRYDRAGAWQARPHTVVRNHWDDRAKLRRDHAYLAALHDELLDDLTKALGRLHRIERSRRYWRTLSDPWLIRYLGVAFDRWETLRVAFDEHDISETYVRACPRAAPFGHVEFTEFTGYDDEWNHDFFARILQRHYAHRCTLRVCESAPQLRTPLNRGLRSTERSPLRRLVREIDRVGAWLSRRNRVVFVHSYFPIPALLRLNLRLGQATSLFLSEFEIPRAHLGPANGIRQQITLRREPKNSFEEFVHTSIIEDLPQVLVESFAEVRACAEAIRLRPRVVFTATAHWFNDLFKHWIAEKVHEGTLLITMDHGGALHPAFGVGDFEEDISDLKATWVLPYRPKQMQLPPSKLAGVRRRESSRGSALGVIGSEMPLYAFAAWSGPISSQTFVGFEQVCSLYEALADEPRRAFAIKPYPEQGWALRQRFVERLGADKVVQTQSFARFIKSARLIVCTYPQTTFSEAIASGIPTLLVYPRHLWETVSLFDNLVEALQQAGIIFFEPVAAARHINTVWSDPVAWWQSPIVRDARSRFERDALDLRIDWISPWLELVRRSAAAARLGQALTNVR